VTPVAEIVSVSDLLNVVWTAFLAGIGVCMIFSFAIVGFARGTDARREKAGGAAIAYFVLMAVALTAVMGAVVFAVIVMTSK